MRRLNLHWGHIPEIKHLSGHMGCTRIDESCFSLDHQVAKEYRIDINLEALNVETLAAKARIRRLKEKD